MPDEIKYKIEVKILLEENTNDDELYDWLHQWLSYDSRIKGFNIDSYEWEEGKKRLVGKKPPSRFRQ